MSGLDFALNFLARMQVEEYYPLHNLWTDEAHYHLDSAVNAQTCCIWGSTNPHSVQQQPLHSPYVTVWCGFTSNFVLGLYSFKDVTMNRFVRCRVTNAWYRRLLEDHVVLALRQKNCLATTVFMQDGAIAHKVQCVKMLFKFTSPMNVSSRVLSQLPGQKDR